MFTLHMIVNAPFPFNTWNIKENESEKSKKLNFKWISCDVVLKIIERKKHFIKKIQYTEEIRKASKYMADFSFLIHYTNRQKFLTNIFNYTPLAVRETILTVLEAIKDSPPVINVFDWINRKISLKETV